jgi:hypothetical protein
MRRTPRLAAAAALVGLLLAPGPAWAWGTSAHRYVIGRAIDLLPPAIKPFFDHFRAELVLRVVDPDLWRAAGWDDDPNHFVNFGVPEFGEYPFDALPREYGAAIEKFGLATLKRDGTLPWRAQEEAGNLRRAMEQVGRKQGLGIHDTVLFAAVAVHYLQDATQPLHASNNYNGQLSGQLGVHARFESELFERFESRLRVEPAAPAAMRNARDAAFDALLASYKLVPAILAADKAAAAGRDTYDDGYFSKFFEAAKPVLEQQLGRAITATAALIIGAWEEAGRPALVTELPRTPQKVRRVRGGDW